MNKDIKNIILKSVLFDLNQEEQQMLDGWLNESSLNKASYERLRCLTSETDILVFLQSVDTEKAFIKTKEKIESRRAKVIKQRIISSLAIASAVLFISFMIYTEKFKENNSEVAVLVQDTKVVKTGKATLELSTGETIALGGEVNMTTEVGDSKLSVDHDNISFVKLEEVNKTKKTKPVTTTLRVPRGESYNLTLSDGTIVWVNAMSELRFSSEFVGDTREVELKGEAYFEVAKNADKPFIVKMADYDVTVLGTSFNISNYEGSKMSKTTLCTGRVEVNMNYTVAEPISLTPGKQLSLNKKNNDVDIQEVDVEQFLAWRDGNYFFEDKPLDELFEVLSRWYEIDEIEYSGEVVKDKLYSGKFKRDTPFEKMIAIIEMGANCKIEYKDKKIRINEIINN